jgi:hypothetical protein
VAAHQKKSEQDGAHLVLIDESGAFLSPLVRRTLAPRGRTPILKTPGRKRQKVSLIAALSIAPCRNRIGLYFRCHPDRHITQHEAAAFMRDVLRHLRGPVHVVWDRGNTHKGDAIRALHRDYPRLTSHWLPPYAPELNPVEYLWNWCKDKQLCNFAAHDVPELESAACGCLEDARHDQQRLRSFFESSPLSWRRTGLI